MKYKTKTRKSLLNKIERLEQLTFLVNDPLPVLDGKPSSAITHDHRYDVYLSNMISVCMPRSSKIDVLTKLTQCLNEKSILKYNLFNLKDTLISKHVALSFTRAPLENPQRNFIVHNCNVPVRPLIKKGGRIPSTAKQYLEFVYSINQHPDSNLKRSIALTTKLSLDTVRIWVSRPNQGFLF